MTALEDRTTPTTVNATAISDAFESGTDGIIRVSRDDTAGDLGVLLDVGGTAANPDDYQLVAVSPADPDAEQPVDGSVTIPDGQSYVDVHVVPVWNGVANTDSRTVSISILPWTDYDAGTSATVGIQDDIDPLPVLVHQSTFQLSGSAGPVNVSLAVTYTAANTLAPVPLYTWVYQVQNPDPPTGTTTWTTFTIPVDSTLGTDDVGNLTAPAGWTGTVGTDNVTFTAGSGGLAPGDTATFSFTTAPRFVAGADVSVSDGGVNVADQPNGKAPAQKTQLGMAYMTFQGTNQIYTVTLTMKVADGSTYTTDPVNISTPTPNGARDVLFTFLSINDWAVTKGDQELNILGKSKTDANGKTQILGIKSLTYSIAAGNGGVLDHPPIFNKAGDVTVTRDGN